MKVFLFKKINLKELKRLNYIMNIIKITHNQLIYQIALDAVCAISCIFFWFSGFSWAYIVFQFYLTRSIYSKAMSALSILESVSVSDFFVL